MHLNFSLWVNLSLQNTARCGKDTFISLQVQYSEDMFTTITKFTTAIIYYVSMA